MPLQFFCPHCGCNDTEPDSAAPSPRPCPECGLSMQFRRRLKPSRFRPGQFGLKTLLLAITALCFIFGTLTWIGAAGVVLFGLLAGITIGIYFDKARYAVPAIIATGLICCLALWMQSTTRDTAKRGQCQSNLYQIALAMHQYNDDHGTLPPAYLADSSGKPMHSWRVLILPYLGPRALQTYRQYDFSEPWDGPHNRLLASRMPDVFSCPAERNRGTYDTSYVVVTGSQTVFNGSQSMSLDQLAAMDGTSATLLVAECAESGIHWMQPRDLRYDQMTFTINDRTGRKGIRSHHANGANVAMADDRVTLVSERVDSAGWESLFTANGGEPGFAF